MSESFYKMDLIAMIDRVAMECLMVPKYTYDKDGNGGTYTLAELNNYNSMVAANNEGVRDMAASLKRELVDSDGE